jgi:hypothetical protein
MAITQELKGATLNAVTRALLELNVPFNQARPLAQKFIDIATAAGQSIDDQLIPWIRSQPKFPRQRVRV